MHARGVGPSPIPVDQFTLQKLVDAIKFMLDPEVTLQILCAWADATFSFVSYRKNR